MNAVGISKAHVSGLSFGASVGTWLAAKYPDKVLLSLSLHSAWSKTDAFLRAVVESYLRQRRGIQSEDAGVPAALRAGRRSVVISKAFSLPHEGLSDVRHVASRDP